MVKSDEIMYRDFVYLDTDRVESILAQLNEGAIANLMKGKTDEITGEATTGLLSMFLPIGLRASGSHKSETQANKVLHDYAYTMALQELKEKHLLVEEKDLPQEGKALPAAAFVLLKGSMSILDYNILSSFLNQGGSTATAKPASDQREQQTQLNREERRKLAKADRRTAGSVARQQPEQSPGKPDGPSQDQSMEMFQTLLGDLLLIRLQDTRGIDYVGPLTRKFLREELRNFIFKYTGAPQLGWTILAQINRTPSEQSTSEAVTQVMQNIASTEHNFQTLSDMFNVFVVMMNAVQGLIASAAGSTVAVTPIAVYREVTPLSK